MSTVVGPDEAAELGKGQVMSHLFFFHLFLLVGG